jgi:hypothetical protein
MNKVSDDKKITHCMWCAKRGGKLQPNPYEVELYGAGSQVRLHDDCRTALLKEI